VSEPEAPVTTDIERLIQAQEETQRLIKIHTDAINGLGTNVQWIIDNVQGIFQMFQNPAFMSNIPAMLAGGMQDGGPEAA
jgi:hypothetical protein